MSYVRINGRTRYIAAGVDQEEFVRNIDLIDEVKKANGFWYSKDAYELIRSDQCIKHTSMKQIKGSYDECKICDEWN